MRDRKSEVVEALARAHDDGRLHHAYVFAGPLGTGKLEAAEEFAARVFSPSGLFGAGDPATALARIRARSHPDFLLLEPEDDAIPVDVVREAIRQVNFAPLEAPLRVVAIRNAHCLNAQAANVLLKTLEEPPAHTKFILTTTDSHLLLQTVRSRSQLIRFPALSSEAIAASLGSDGARFVHWAEGSVPRAKKMMEDPESEGIRAEAAQMLLGQWEAAPRIPSDMLAFVEGVSDYSELVLDSWLGLARDLAVVGQGVPLHHEELVSRLEKLVQRYADQKQALWVELAEKCAAIHRFRVFLDRNGNQRTGWDHLVPSLQLFAPQR